MRGFLNKGWTQASPNKVRPPNVRAGMLCERLGRNNEMKTLPIPFREQAVGWNFGGQGMPISRFNILVVFGTLDADI